MTTTSDWVNVIVGFAKTTNVTVTLLAAANVASPLCDATIVQFPTVSSVTKISLTVHTDSLLEAKLTGRPEDEVADKVIGEVLIFTFPCVKVIV